MGRESPQMDGDQRPGVRSGQPEALSVPVPLINLQKAALAKVTKSP